MSDNKNANVDENVRKQKILLQNALTSRGNATSWTPFRSIPCKAEREELKFVVFWNEIETRTTKYESFQTSCGFKI